MAIKGYMESTLASSEVFQGICQSATNNPKSQSVTLIKTAKHLTKSDIEAAYITVKQITDSMTRAALLAFEEGRVVLVYNNVPQLSVTQALPFITYKVGGQYVTYVFVDKYITITRDGILNMPPAILRDLLTGATLANGLYRDYSRMSSNPYLQGILTEIYVKLFSRILNREYSIASDRQVIETVQYWIGRFFLQRVFGSLDTPENIELVAKKIFRYMDDLGYQEIKEKYDQADPVKISDLLELVKTASHRMKDLDLGRFLNAWVNYYWTPVMLAVDTPEYLIFMCIALLSGTNIANMSASDIVKEAKNIKSFRAELLKLIQ